MCFVIGLIIGLWWWKWGYNIIDSAILERFEVSNVIDGKGTGRLDIWSNSLQYFFRESSLIRLFFGYGYDSFMEVSYMANHGYRLAHNILIQVLVEQGFIGLILLCVFLLKLFLSMVRHERYFMTGAIIGYVSVGMTLDINRTRIFGLLVGLALMYSAMVSRPQEVLEKEYCRKMRGSFGYTGIQLNKNLPGY
jgi:hypothetical protein